VLKSRLKFPCLITVLIFLSPQMVLFQRNARYYSLLIFLYAVLVLHLSTDFHSRLVRRLTAGMIFIFLFHTHTTVAFCSVISLLVFCLFFRRGMLVEYCFATGAGFLTWLVWYQLLGPPFDKMTLPLSLVATNFPAWLDQFFTGLVATLVDLDVVACIPMVAWGGGDCFPGCKKTPGLRYVFHDPVPQFILLSILVHTVANAALFGYETGEYHSVLRYLIPIMVTALILLSLIINTAVTNRCLYVLVAVFVISFNPLTFSFWAKPFFADGAAVMAPSGLYGNIPAARGCLGRSYCETAPRGVCPSRSRRGHRRLAALDPGGGCLLSRRPLSRATTV